MGGLLSDDYEYRGKSTHDAVAGLLNLDPDVVWRATMPFIPRVKYADGREDWGVPQPIVDAVRAVVTPGHAMRGGAVTHEDALNTVLTVGAGGLLAKRPAGSLGVVSRVDVPAMPYKKSLPKGDLFRDAVKETPGAAITKDGVALRVSRAQKPEQAYEPSTRGGVFYLPEGDKNMAHYRRQGSTYGGSENISGETMFKRPLFVKGATGGKAPEAAYDELLGKGAIKELDRAVHNAVFAPNNIREEVVTQFLEEHAPEMADLAYDIIRNSGKGNQLRYALREAAIGSAVRRAGHDGVLGYSTRRKTKQPFISEVFDVRENIYPDKSGDYGVWDEFEPTTRGLLTD